MNNFLDFIDSDIEAKKTLLSSMPINNKTNIKKYNEKIASICESYKYYKESVLKYLEAKSESFECSEERVNVDEIFKEFEEYKNMKFLLNPMNSFKEKMGFDNLFYDIHNYSNFTFEDINGIIKKIIKKFKVVGIDLNADDFKYTCYVNEYMTEFFKVSDDYTKLNEVFEKIYWYNPNIIEHIELNFRKLIRKYHKNFESYISREQQTLLRKNNFKDYGEFLTALKQKYHEFVGASDESIHDIIEMAKKSEIEINNYFSDSKFRLSTFSSLTINEIDYSDEKTVEELLSVLGKLRTNVLEYSNYLKFIPLFNYFKDKYGKKSSIDSNAVALKNLTAQISAKESKLESINSKIFNDNKISLSLFKKSSSENLKNLKIESLNIAKELYDLYYKEEQMEFENRIFSLKNDSLLLISDVVRLYYSYNFFKKETFEKIFNLTTYNEVIDLCNEFDEFAANPTNIIINGINTFEDTDVASVICNKYKLENINLEVADLDEDSLFSLRNKIDFVFRVYKIERSNLSVEKIWFIVQVYKILGKERNGK
jgi:hypothetical protein